MKPLRRKIATAAVDAAAAVYVALRASRPYLAEYAGYAAVSYGAWQLSHAWGWIVGGLLAAQTGFRRG